MEILGENAVGEARVRLIKGDLTEADVDAIVNAANSRLQHGGGVAGAIVRKGGRVIQEESNKIGHVPVGQAAMTGAGSLKARHVIHAVGPVWGEGDEERKLRSAVKSTLRLASEHNFKSVAMPAISAGIFGFPKEQNAHIITAEIAAFLASERTSLESVDIYLMDQEIIGFFETEVKNMKNIRTGT